MQIIKIAELNENIIIINLNENKMILKYFFLILFNILIQY